jgi:hypothetical protein
MDIIGIARTVMFMLLLIISRYLLYDKFPSIMYARIYSNG